MSICSQSIFMERPRLKLFYSRNRRELLKLLIIFIYVEDITHSHLCFLLFSCSHLNAVLMRIIRLFKNMGGGQENNCSHSLLPFVLPQPAHLKRCFLLLKYFK